MQPITWCETALLRVHNVSQIIPYILADQRVCRYHGPAKIYHWMVVRPHLIKEVYIAVHQHLASDVVDMN